MRKLIRVDELNGEFELNGRTYNSLFDLLDDIVEFVRENHEVETIEEIDDYLDASLLEYLHWWTFGGDFDEFANDFNLKMDKYSIDFYLEFDVYMSVEIRNEIRLNTFHKFYKKGEQFTIGAWNEHDCDDIRDFEMNVIFSENSTLFNELMGYDCLQINYINEELDGFQI